MSETSTEIATVSTGEIAVANSNRNFSTLQPKNFAERMLAAKAVTNSLPLADHAGKVILMKHIIVKEIEITDKRTGETNRAPRVVLLDDTGVAYHATSDVVYNTLTDWLNILGHPSTWPAAIPVKMVKAKAATGTMFTLEFAE